MDVLVYSADGNGGASRPEYLNSLRQCLFPNYAVAPVTKDVLLKEPWTKSCALLVVSGEDYPALYHAMGVQGTARISQFVRSGGAFLGINAGAYYGSSSSTRCELNVDNGVKNEAEANDSAVFKMNNLGFFPGKVCRAQPSTTNVGEETTVRTLRLLTTGAAAADAAGVKDVPVYSGGGGDGDIFWNVGNNVPDNNAEVLATFAQDSLAIYGGGEPAVVYCRVGEGACVLSSTHLEMDPRYFTSDRKGRLGGSSSLATLLENDGTRAYLLRRCLSRLGLKVNTDDNKTPPPLSAMYMSSADPSDAYKMMNSWRAIMKGDYIIDQRDTFLIQKQSTDQKRDDGDGGEEEHVQQTLQVDHVGGAFGEQQQVVAKRIIVCDQGYPTSKEVTFFDHQQYFASLGQQSLHASEYAEREGIRFEKHLLYGDVMDSTNTILASNHGLLRHLPTGFTVLASLQTAGRGRGSNTWVSPLGCLLFSTCVRHPFSACAKSPVSFVQYIASIAIVEAVKSYSDGFQDFPIKIKWPNDIYVQEDTQSVGGQAILAKIGGILVQCSTNQGGYLLVVGIGLNTTNAAPTTSLRCLLDVLNISRVRRGLAALEPFSLEKLLARILIEFERLYVDFRRDGWRGSLQERYLKHWLHTGQVVTMESIAGAPRGRVTGISSETGHLCVEELNKDGQSTGQVHELWPDGNSFDFFHGLLKTKA